MGKKSPPAGGGSGGKSGKRKKFSILGGESSESEEEKSAPKKPVSASIKVSLPPSAPKPPGRSADLVKDLQQVVERIQKDPSLDVLDAMTLPDDYEYRSKVMNAASTLIDKLEKGKEYRKETVKGLIAEASAEQLTKYTELKNSDEFTLEGKIDEITTDIENAEKLIIALHNAKAVADFYMEKHRGDLQIARKIHAAVLDTLHKSSRASSASQDDDLLPNLGNNPELGNDDP
jgi:hypothetical protein